MNKTNEKDILIEEANKHYDLYDRKWFETLSDEELAVLWSECIITEYNPLGAAWDDEVYDAIYDRKNRDAIFECARALLIKRNEGEEPYYA